MQEIYFEEMGEIARVTPLENDPTFTYKSRMYLHQKSKRYGTRFRS